MREHAHNSKRQYRRQCEAQGLVTKSGRQWKKFRKMMKRMVKETTMKNVMTGIEDMKEGRYTILDPETLVTEDTLKGIEEARENLGTELTDADLREDGINDGLVEL